LAVIGLKTKDALSDIEPVQTFQMKSKMAKALSVDLGQVRL
jgi:hypothetical protein